MHVFVAFNMNIHASPATFRILYVLEVIEHSTRRPAQINVIASPSADWSSSSCEKS